MIKTQSGFQPTEEPAAFRRLVGFSSLLVTLSAYTADYLEKVPAELRDSVTAYFPFDGSYEDVTGKIDAQYFNAKEPKSYGVAEVADSSATFRVVSINKEIVFELIQGKTAHTVHRPEK